MPTPTDPTLEAIVADARARYRTVEEMAVAAIRRAVLTGVFAPGEKLPQATIAESLGISRIPVRGALRQLEAEGLVVFTPHRGATVRTLTPDDIDEIYELRVLLESFTLRSAIDNATPEDIAELDSIAAELDATAGGPEWLALRERFSERINAIANRPLTAELIAKLRSDVGRYWLSLRVVDHASHGHRVIVDAIRNRDAAAGERWLGEHLREVSAELRLRMQTAHDADSPGNA